jgi:hypothetical protein
VRIAIARNHDAIITYGCVSRPSLVYPRRRSANGFLPSGGSAAGVPVSVARLAQRIAADWPGTHQVRPLPRTASPSRTHPQGGRFANEILSGMA